MAGKVKVLVAMSGGVDSSLAASTLLERGYDVIGVHLKLLDPESLDDGETSCDRSCCGVDGAGDARAVASVLGIQFYVLDYRRIFDREVIDPFCREYLQGKTPNPCVPCNEKIKFGKLLDLSRSLEVDHVATGHYARIIHDPGSGRYRLARGADAWKDQSYFLYSLSQDQLKYILFPLGELTKEQTRRMAKNSSLPVHDKPGSQDICFAPAGRYGKFIENRTRHISRSGPIFDGSGRKVGKHPGISYFTVGQRRGLGVSFGKPMYVTAIDPERNAIVIGERKDCFRTEFLVSNINWMMPEPERTFEATVKIRYGHRGARASITPLPSGCARVTFDIPQKAITPGQAAVFYDAELVSGGGTIDHTIQENETCPGLP